jgi:hypothetical protein
LAWNEIDVGLQRFRKVNLQAGLIEQAESPLWQHLEQEIDVGIVARNIAGDRAEQKKCRNASRA